MSDNKLCIEKLIECEKDIKRRKEADIISDDEAPTFCLSQAMADMAISRGLLVNGKCEGVKVIVIKD